MGLIQRARLALVLGTLAFLPKSLVASSTVDLKWYQQWYTTLILPVLLTTLAVFVALTLGWLISKSPLRKWWLPNGNLVRILYGFGVTATVALSALPANLPNEVEWLTALFIPAWFLMIFSISGWHESLLPRVEPDKAT